MYDVEKLVSVVCDYLDAEADYKKYSLNVRKELELAPDSTLWIPSLNGSKAYRLGELSEKSGATGSILADICAMLDINQELLVATVKSMQWKSLAVTMPWKLYVQRNSWKFPRLATRSS